MGEQKQGWFLPLEAVNSLQAESIDWLISRARGAHHADVDLRINGKNELHQADWIKHMQRAGATSAAALTRLMPYSPDPESDDYPTVKESMEAAMRREEFHRKPGLKAWGCLRETQAMESGEDPASARCVGYCGHPACPTSAGVIPTEGGK